MVTFIRRILVILIFIKIAIITNISLCANYPLEIIQPKEGLDTRNRFYKAYPGIPFNVRLAVIGGAYPYTYSLILAPSGMTINSSTGEINWPNPITTGSPHKVTAQVTDSEGTTARVTWTITVTTSGFLFIDSVNGDNSNIGSIDSPKKDFIGIYGGTTSDYKHVDTYANYFLYFRGGNYLVDGYVGADNDVQWDPVAKPKVWLAYPGETVTLNFPTNFLYMDSRGDDIYIDGFIFNVSNNRVRGIHIENTNNRVTIRNCTFRGNATGKDGDNPSFIMQRYGGSPGYYWVFQNNSYDDTKGIVENAYFILLYDTRKILIEDNTIQGLEGHIIGPKEGTQYVSIRNNRIKQSGKNAIQSILSNSRGYAAGDIEICYNLIMMTGGTSYNAIGLWVDGAYAGGPVYVYRNTIVGGRANAGFLSNANGPEYWYRNIIINTDTSEPDHIYDNNVSALSRLIRSDNLSGSPLDGIVDSEGNLTSAYSMYLNTHGYQLADPFSPPSPPRNLRIIPN